MKLIALAVGLLLSAAVFSQPIVSHVYSISGKPEKAPGTPNTFFSGSGAILASHHMSLIGLLQGKSSRFSYDRQSPERFFVIAEGQVTANLNGQTTVLDRGSVIVVLPGDKLVIENTGTVTAKYYMMEYRSIAAADPERGKKAGPSFVMKWSDMVFKPHDKGGVRQLFDRQTTMLNRFDIHVTTLNPGLKSHDPHTHTNEEIILLLEGNAEMQIGTAHEKANPGDVVFLASTVLHNLTNIGTTPCLYFAIQWN